MKCTINWGVCTRTQWENMLQKCQHVTILQSYYYAQAMREVHFQSVRHGIISINGEPAGVVQMQEVALFGKAIHFISIDRGPLWFDGFGGIEHQSAFWNAINEQFSRRIGRKRRFIPEILSDYSMNSGFKYKKSDKYKTFFVDLGGEVDFLHSKLNKKWRNVLNKAEKCDLKVDIDTELATLSELLNNYMVDRAHKNYGGASAKFISVLSKYAARTEDCIIFNAVYNHKTIATIMIFTHGCGATYQIGWTNSIGRERGAHHFLLWEAIKYLKERNIKCFDLGGYNDEAEGVKKFKRGLGGQDIALIGSYS